MLYLALMKRVDNIPIHLQPLFLFYGYVFGLLMYLFVKFIKLTCRLQFTGYTVPPGAPVVYCIWHRDLVNYFAVYNRVQKQAWMNHPAWYMKPVHVLLGLTGVQHICLGSSGNSGKQALENVLVFLKRGYSTTVACDGPAGPPRQLKPGVLLMSRHAQLPVVTLRFSCSRYIKLGGWDQKIVPCPFSKITIHVGEPVQVTADNMELAADVVVGGLNS